MLKGSFKTAYLQREIPMDVAVIGSEPLHVGQLVTLTAAASGKPNSIAAANTLAAATHIVAQSDMTLGYGHVPVENRDWNYKDEVAVTGSALATTTPVKHVALYAITDETDIIVKEV